MGSCGSQRAFWPEKCLENCPKKSLKTAEARNYDAARPPSWVGPLVGGCCHSQTRENAIFSTPNNGAEVWAKNLGRKKKKLIGKKRTFPRRCWVKSMLNTQLATEMGRGHHPLKPGGRCLRSWPVRVNAPGQREKRALQCVCQDLCITSQMLGGRILKLHYC